MVPKSRNRANNSSFASIYGHASGAVCARTILSWWGRIPMFRKNVRKIAYAMTLILCVPAAALACEGDDCPTPAKPLDIKQFMREQAASTRGGARRAPHRKAAAAKPEASRPTHRRREAAPTAAPLASDAAPARSLRIAAAAGRNCRMQPVPSPRGVQRHRRAAPAPANRRPPARRRQRSQRASGRRRRIQRHRPQGGRELAVSHGRGPVAAEPAKPQAAPAPTLVSWLQWSVVRGNRYIHRARRRGAPTRPRLTAV